MHPANVQDRDGVFHLLRRARRMFPFIERIFADGGYAGPKMALVALRHESKLPGWALRPPELFATKPRRRRNGFLIQRRDRGRHGRPLKDHSFATFPISLPAPHPAVLEG